MRAWEYRQRRHAKGVWFRLRRLLALAESAWAISGEEADRLEAEGFAAEPLGAEIVPQKRIFVVDESQLVRLESRRPLDIGLSQDFLAARCVVLERREDNA